MREVVKNVIHKNMRIFIVMIALIVCASISVLLPPIVLEKAVNALGNRELISLTLAIAYFLCILLSDVLQSAENASITKFGQKLTHGMRSALSEKLNRLPSDDFVSQESGEMASIFVNDADTIDTLYSDGVVGMASNLFQLIGILVMIFVRSIGLGIIMLVVMPMILLITRHFQKTSLEAQKDNRKAIGKVNHHIPETMRVMKMVHNLEKEPFMEKTYETYIEDSYKAQQRSYFLDSVYSPVILFIQACVIALMIIGATTSSLKGLFHLSVGSAAAMIAYVNAIFSPLESIGMEIQNIQEAVAGMSRINTFLKRPDYKPEEYNGKGDYITFDHVTFGYNETPVLEDVSFSVKEGEMITMTGRTGRGKSTIFKLLLGLYQPSAGKILIDGHSPDVHPENQRHFLSCCEQNFEPILGTIKDQITLNDPTISDEDVLEALEKTGLLEIVMALDEGLETPFEKTRFSQGELQLLNIARAAAGHPKILLLDEMTANLDSKTEEQVLTAIANVSYGRTVLSISHRPIANRGRIIHF
jgi:ABC-type multidrug transport system fused ATPase/permease subunit